MNKSEIKKLVEHFEDKVLINFDTHLSYLVLEDFYSGGYNDRIEDEFFYDEYFKKYEKNIISLLLHIEYKMDSDYMDFKIRLIKLKRIIDNHFIKIGKSPTQIRPIRQSRITYFHLKDNIDKNKFVSLLYDELTSKNFIDCPVQVFEELFNEMPNRFKVQWIGTELQLTLLVNSLLGYFDSDVSKQHYKLTTNLFVNKKGNDFKPKQLSSVYTEKVDLIKPNDPVHKIIEKISTHLPLV
ncbi:MAG: hypothetical protein CSA38_02620 [Flavobacteriales bacterium]|nr:MAG: hypothetical protein CSA38_02620 [Flavobacteriales bacterium]